MDKLLQIKNLKIDFFDDDNSKFTVVDDISFELDNGVITGLVGESGCGKSITALSIMNLIPHPVGQISAGKIIFKNKDLLKLTTDEIHKIRGNEISMIFQEPMNSLSPLKKIYSQLSESLELHNQSLKKKERREICREWLNKVGIQDAENRLNAFPFELSGGMQQRVMIAMALMMQPNLLIADEPTTALDVTIQAQILDLLLKMQEDLKTSILLITHDLSIVSEVCEKVMVMYAGKIIETSDVSNIFENPRHPYTQGLLKAAPSLTKRNKRLYSIPGYVPASSDKIAGCKFAPRCDRAMTICFSEQPKLTEYQNSVKTACFWAEKNK